MAVPCPRCGREYDVALFQFGRTIHCTCGRRVALEPRVRSAARAKPRFAADAMLGRLARWLRVIGCDTSFAADISDAELVRLALAEDRVILTRDRALPLEWTVPRVLLLESERPAAQLHQVVLAFGLDWRSRSFTRCSRCNCELESCTRAEVRGLVPERVWLSQESFRRCRECRRVYWEGSHVDRMHRALERILSD